MGETCPPPGTLLYLSANGFTGLATAHKPWCGHGHCHPGTEGETKAQQGLVTRQGHTAGQWGGQGSC